ncbi:DNA primase [uncultured Comamonas sp.]|nr:DNA primase [uncultured Comamonas sp.]
MSIPASFIQDLLQRVDIVDVVGRYVPLKKSGANFMGLCPFHGEKSPSFSVSPVKQFFHCFGCGKGGDAIAFLREHTGMEFMEAVQSLAQEVGMQVPQEDISPQQRAQRQAVKQQQDSLVATMERAAQAYCEQLKSAPHAIDYLKRRGVSGTVSSRYGLGYAPAGWNYLASVFPDYTSRLLEEGGLVIHSAEDEDKRYDRFRDRIMFPIRDVKGQCIGFGGRVLGDDKPKYLNSPETPLFHKGRELYGLHEARTDLREAGYALVCEGYMDVVALAQLGFPNAVATLGTACTGEHVHKLFRFTEAVVFSFDGDAAGQRAARKALEAVLPLVNDTRSVKFLFLPPEHDPDSFIRTHGADAFTRMVHAAMPFNQFLLQVASEGCDLGTAPGRARLSNQAQPLWSLLPPSTLKRLVLDELAQHIALPAQELEAIWQRSIRNTAPVTMAPPPQDGYQGHGNRRGERLPWEPGRGRQSAPPPPSRRVEITTGPDQAVRLLLGHMALLERLDNDDWDALVHLPAPHGPLFAWAEAFHQAHGTQSWAAVQQQLDATGHREWVQRLMSGPLGHPEDDPQAQHQELRSILKPLLTQRIRQLQTQLAQAYASDPGNQELRQRYQALLERSKNL